MVLIPPVLWVVRELSDDNVTLIVGELTTSLGEVGRAARGGASKEGNIVDVTLLKVDSDLVHRVLGRVSNVEVDWFNFHGGVGAGEDGVWQVGLVWDVVHAEVEPDDEILLVDGFAVEVLAEVDDGVFDIDGVIWMGGLTLGFLALGDVHVVSGPFGGLSQVGGALDGHVNWLGGWVKLVSSVFSVLVGDVLVDNGVAGSSVGTKVDGSLGVNPSFLQLHGVSWFALVPVVLLGGWDELSRADGVFGSSNVEVDLVVENVVVHRSGKMVVDVVSIVLVVGKVSRLDITGGADLNAHRSIKVEMVIEHVIVVSNCGDGTNDKVDVLGGGSHVRLGVTGKWISRVVLKETDGVNVRIGSLRLVVGGVQVAGVCWAIVSLEKLKGPWTESVESIEVSSTRLMWVVSSVMGEGLLQSNLVDDALSLVLDVEKTHSSISAESDVEGESHPFNVLLLCVNLVTSSGWGNGDWWVHVLVQESLSIWIGPSKRAINWSRQSADLSGLKGCTEILDSVIVDVIVEQTKNLPFRWVTAGDV